MRFHAGSLPLKSLRRETRNQKRETAFPANSRLSARFLPYMFNLKRISIGKNTMYAIFLAGYLLMGLLVMEQGRVIENQQVLIRSLFYDSSQLTAMRMHPDRR